MKNFVVIVFKNSRALQTRIKVFFDMFSAFYGHTKNYFSYVLVWKLFYWTEFGFVQVLVTSEII